MELEVPCRVVVRLGAQAFVYDLRERLGPVPHGTRYAAADVSSVLAPEPGTAGAHPLNVVLLTPTGADHAERLRRAAEWFPAEPHPSLLAVYGIGAVEGGPAHGLIALVTEPRDETLEDALARDRALTEADARALFGAVSSGLFALHDSGAAHGDLTPRTVARAVSGWRLLPGHPELGAETDRPADVLAAGRLLRAALGWGPPPVERAGPLGPLVPYLPAESGSGVIGRLFGRARIAEEPRLMWRVTAAPPPPPRSGSALSRSNEVAAAWRTVLAGCEHPNPALRWPAARLVFGAVPPPLVSDLRAEAASENAFRLSWTVPPTGRVLVCDLGDRDPRPYGSIASVAELPNLAPLPAPTGATLTVQLTGNVRRLQAVTVIDGLRVAAFGAWVRLTRVPNVQNLRVRADRGQLTMTWDWPADLHFAHVTVRNDRFPATADDGQQTKCLRSQYEANGRFIMPVPAGAGAGLFVTVFAAQRVPGGTEFAPGARYQLEQWPMQLRYRLHRTPTGYELLLTPNRSGALPALVLVAGGAQQPLDANAGTPVAQVPPGFECGPARTGIVPFADPAIGPRKAKLFCARATDYDWLELISDPADGVSLN